MSSSVNFNVSIDLLHKVQLKLHNKDKKENFNELHYSLTHFIQVSYCLMQCFSVKQKNKKEMETRNGKEVKLDEIVQEFFLNIDSRLI